MSESKLEADAILEPAGSRVRDPLTGRSIWLAGMVREGAISGEVLRLTLSFTRNHGAEDQKRIREALVRNIEGLGWKGEIEIHTAFAGEGGPTPPRAAPAKDPVRGMSGPGMQPHGGPIEKKELPGVARVIAVASGKGGVGKSTVACNLAVGLARMGLQVGLMDADIYGPSLPIMMGVKGKPFANQDKKVIPLESHGVKCMSIGFLVDDREPIIWRGPMVMGVVKQFLQDVEWAPLDLLVIDLPPGTGDAQLTMIQAVDLAGAVVVTTPQEVAVLDAVRGTEMFKKLNVPVLGIVENMSYMELPGGGRLHPFGQGGGERTAREYGVPLLAQLPLEGSIGAGGDAGRPAALGDDGVAQILAQMAGRVWERLEG